jgi:alkylhydroperoxidase/carboxymuconolactone decarboxylase family protein YurZ
VAPQLATYVLETVYGEIYQSEALDSRTRQIVTVATLATLGTQRRNCAPISAARCVAASRGKSWSRS